MNTKHDIRSLRTQQSLRRALFEMIDEKPLNEITVTRLTERAGVSRATFYLYFDSIESMTSSIVSDLYASFMDSVDSALAMGLNFKETCMVLLSQPFSDGEQIAAYRAMIRAGCIDGGMISRGIVEARKKFNVFFADGAGEEELDYVLEFVAGGIGMSIVRWAMADNSEISPEGLKSILLTVLFRYPVHLDAIRRK